MCVYRWGEDWLDSFVWYIVRDGVVVSRLLFSIGYLLSCNSEWICILDLDAHSELAKFPSVVGE